MYDTFFYQDVKKIFFLLIFLITSACYESKTKNNANANDCNLMDIACTEEFRTITLEIVDVNDNPVILDSFKITRKDTGKKIELNKISQQNFYPIINDSYQNEIAHKELNLKFTGYINNIEVVSTNYVVSADCCHIALISGKTKITL